MILINSKENVKKGFLIDFMFFIIIKCLKKKAYRLKLDIL